MYTLHGRFSFLIKLGKFSVPHPHVIKDLMKPDQHVADEAVWNPQHITKTYRLEPKNY